MKKRIFIISLFIFAVSNLFAQGYSISTGTTTSDKFLLASLPKTGTSNFQKLKIEILGGSFYNDNLGRAIYTISTRGLDTYKNSIRISKEQYGGATSRYEFVVYEKDSTYDFVLKTTSNYVSVIVQTWLSQKPTYIPHPITMQEIIKYDDTRAKEVTNDEKLIEFINIMTTDNLGNIGIGTETPKSKLDVRGKITAKEVEIKVITGADFVFKPDYNLMPLSEVEAFVKENQHLPEVPSEKEMVENGLNINEMQIKLLQKIEELTLHVIEQEKQNKKLQEQIISLSERIK